MNFIDKISANNELCYIEQNNSNINIHYMNWNNSVYLIIILDTNIEGENPKILIFLSFHYITYELL